MTYMQCYLITVHVVYYTADIIFLPENMQLLTLKQMNPWLSFTAGVKVLVDIRDRLEN